MNSRLSKYVKTRFVRIASDLMENPQGLKFKLEKAAEKITKKNVIESIGVYVDDLKALIRMARLWVSRKYTDVGTQTILYTIVAIIYFVTPTDFVPDFVLGLGFVDDVAVLNWVLSLIKEDLNKFKAWEEKGRANKNAPDLNEVQIELNINDNNPKNKSQKKA
ncbi:MAG: hypothetical protein CME62_10400 [Halobacteriovoraceae bacterium]|nr:hypothetical protein [Halobacteriovoraceae bacterium]|tara:strand:+ start:12757 stop:13245 length:489 start_codon:yes stop_codon:yes gene_type:complete